MNLQGLSKLFNIKNTQYCHEYISDICRAVEQGSIKIAHPRQLMVDEYSHFNKVNDFNTRPLSGTAKAFVELIGKQRSSISYLEIGAGLAGAAYGIKRLALQKGFKVDIDLNSLTPVAPRFGLLKNAKQIQRQYRFFTGKIADNLTLDTLFELQNQGVKIFDELKENFIRCQYIGDHLETDINEKYDFILDDQGALYQTIVNYFGHFDVFEKSSSKTLSLLKPEGFLYLKEMPDYLLSHLSLPGYSFLRHKNCKSKLIFGQESMFRKAIEGSRKNSMLVAALSQYWQVY